MCYVCIIDDGIEYEGTLQTPQDTAFADQFKMEFRDLARHDFSHWLADNHMAIVITEEQLATYDALFMLACKATLRLLNNHDLAMMLDERAALRGESK